MNAAQTDYSREFAPVYLLFAALAQVSKSSIEWRGGQQRARPPFRTTKEWRQDPFVPGDFLQSFGPPIETQWRRCVGTRISNDWY